MHTSRARRALIVDDLRLTRRILIAGLSAHGFTEIVEAADGHEAWRALDQTKRRFDLIIADWHMPSCTGLELLKMVRGEPRFAALPFLMFTAEDEPEQVAQAVRAGVTGYLTKPLDLEQLGRALGRLADASPA